jgi:hypothetical protein
MRSSAVPERDPSLREASPRDHRSAPKQANRRSPQSPGGLDKGLQKFESALSRPAIEGSWSYPTNTRAFRNNRIHPLHSPASSKRHEF